MSLRDALFLGLLIFGLHLMGDAVKPLREHRSVEQWLRGLSDPVQGAPTGVLGTAIIQSSSAMLGIAIKLASAGLLGLQAGVAIMLGAEIGTCLDTLVGSVGRSREALRVGVFHLVFNVVSVTIGLLCASQIEAAAQWLPGDSIARQIANAHVLFNLADALVFVSMLPLCAAALRTLVRPEAGADGAGQPEMA